MPPLSEALLDEIDRRAKKALGAAALEQLIQLLGEPSSYLYLGRFEYARYSHIGLDIIYNDRHVIGIRCMPPRIPDTLPEPIRREMQSLQGIWKLVSLERRGKNEGLEALTGCIEFDGSYVTLYGGGVAVSVCYRLELGKDQKAMHFLLPDPKDDAEWKKKPEDGLPRKAVYTLAGNDLTIQLPLDKEGEKGKDSTEPRDLVSHLKRMPTEKKPE